MGAKKIMDIPLINLLMSEYSGNCSTISCLIARGIKWFERNPTKISNGKKIKKIKTDLKSLELENFKLLQ